MDGTVGEVRTTQEGGWLQRLRRRAPALFLTLVFWLAAELLATVLLPVVVPRHVALGWYLGDEARETTRGFLADGHPFLLYDPLTGWRTRPSCGKDHWWIDSLGSRSTHPLGLRRMRPRRLLFLGNSMTNGGFDVAGWETIPAYSEDSLTEAGNFATMLYSLDQSYLAYQSRLHRFGGDVVVVNLLTKPDEGLTSRYVPFRAPRLLMPYFKPRFVREGDSLRLVPVPSRERWRSMFVSSAVLDTLGRGDGFLGAFESYRRFGLMPLAGGLRQVCMRAANLWRRMSVDAEDLPLAVRLMHELVVEAARHDAKVVFMVLPYRLDAFPPGWRRWLPDHYGQTLALLRREGFTVLDARAVLRATGLPPARLYQPDRMHYRPAANRAIAAGLRRLLAEVAWPAPAPGPGTAAPVRARGR
jgi:hypothetical protein